MKLVRPSYEIIEQGPGLQGIYDIIEKCGKVSYKSEPKGGETAKRFVEARAKEGHGAVLEFGTVYLKIPLQDPVKFDGEEYSWDAVDAAEFYDWNPYSKVHMVPDGSPTHYYITTNYRVLVENDRLDDLRYLCEPTEHHEKRYAVKFITDIGLGRDFLRHRTMSMVQESTRYVNYSKEKFGSELTFVVPPWISRDELSEGQNVIPWNGDWADTKGNPKIVCYTAWRQSRVGMWLSSMWSAERDYFALTREWSSPNEEGNEKLPDKEAKAWAAEQARSVLPLSTKTELVLCGFKDSWAHFFNLRSGIAATGKPHPESLELVNPLMEEFVEKGYVTERDMAADRQGYYEPCRQDNNLMH